MTIRNAYCISTWLAAAAALFLLGCQPAFQRIDHRVDTLVKEGSTTLGPDAHPPTSTRPINADARTRLDRHHPAAEERPDTVNPAASQLQFQAIDEASDVIARLDAYATSPESAMKIDLPFALTYATKTSREYKFAEEEYVLSALRLMIERHLWGPRFFSEISALAVGRGNDGLYDTSLQLVSQIGVSQRLPYGGDVSARMVATAAEDLHQAVASEGVQSATVILEGNLPLLRGAGLSARESRIQSERNLIYAAREFEEFRRQFFFEVSSDFLDLIVAQQSVVNAELEVRGLQLVADREQALYEAGRSPLFQKGLAEQSTVSAIDALNSRRENYRLAVDRFKVRLGIPVDQAVEIVASGYDLPAPDVDLNEAVAQALEFRLDLQTRRDIVEDALRGVEVARNDILPDLDLVGSVDIPTDPTRRRGGLRFSPNDSDFSAGVTLSLPLDRDIERIGLRQAQIQLERSRRSYEQQRDLATINVRSAVRDIDRARFTLQIQERSVAIGQQRVESIEAAPDRATARDSTEANNALARARDSRDNAARDLQVAILRYLLETGQLRVDSNGHLLPLQGMPVQVVGDQPAAP